MWIQQCQSAKAQIGTLKSNQALYTIVGTTKYIVAKSNYHAKQQSENYIHYYFHRQGNGSFGGEDMQTLFTEKE